MVAEAVPQVILPEPIVHQDSEIEIAQQPVEIEQEAEPLYEERDFVMEHISSQIDNEQLKDLSHRASQDYVFEKLKDMDQNRFLNRPSQMDDSSLSSDRYVPK